MIISIEIVASCVAKSGENKGVGNTKMKTVASCREIKPKTHYASKANI